MANRLHRLFGSGAARGVVKTLLKQLPHFLKLLYGLFRDARVSRGDKALVAGVIAYVLTPVDLIPDIFPGIGLVDDLYLLGLALDRLLNRAGSDVLLDHWDEEPGDLYRITDELDRLGSLLPDSVRGLLRGRVEKRS